MTEKQKEWMSIFDPHTDNGRALVLIEKAVILEAYKLYGHRKGYLLNNLLAVIYTALAARLRGEEFTWPDFPA